MQTNKNRYEERKTHGAADQSQLSPKPKYGAFCRSIEFI